MRVLYDYQILTRQEYGGISRYFYNISRRLCRRCDVKVVCLFSRNYYFKRELGRISYGSKLSEYAVRAVNFIAARVYILLFNRSINVVHPTYCISYGGWIKALGIRQVVTVHDLIPELFWKGSISPGKRFTLCNKRKSIKRADAIIAVSDNTKRDLLECYPHLDENKVYVVRHGSPDYSKVPFADMRAEYGDYILFVGSRRDYKNFSTFLEALSTVFEAQRDLKCICAGGGAFTGDEARLIKSLGLESRVIQKSVTDAELVNLYRGAVCFCFPSLYEGFGIPILEAFAAKCPVVLSSCSCFPEVAGDAAAYFDGRSSRQMAEKILEVIQNEDYRESLIKKGSERALLFSWSKAAKETLWIYEKVTAQEEKK